MTFALDKELQDCSASLGKEAAALKTISNLLRERPVIGGVIHMPVDIRDRLCAHLDESAEILDEISMVAEVSAETIPAPAEDDDSETRL